MAEKTLILVVGPHRSGTSAVAGALAAMGVDLGTNLLGPAPDNPRGFFEHRDALAIHEWLLREFGGSWDRPVSFTEWISRCHRLDEPDPVKPALAEMRRILAEFEGPICAIKDPRSCLFLDLWRGACKDEGIRLCVLEVRRERTDSISSLMEREKWDYARAGRVTDYYSKILRQEERRGLESWSILRFPEDAFSEDAWRVALLGAGVDPEDFGPVFRFLDRNLIHHEAIPGDQGPPWTVVIPSRSDPKVTGCVVNLLETHPEIAPDQIVIVSDGLGRRTRRELADCTWVKGAQPFIFSRAINMGAAAADPESDLVILGDDVRFRTPGALDHLWHRSHAVAAIAPEVRGTCGQVAQRIGEKRIDTDWLAFICVYIPRAIWDAVGPLDERFVGYGYDDIDWCLRASDHGPLRVAHGILVDHLEDSSYRKRRDWVAKYDENRHIFETKWKERISA